MNNHVPPVVKNIIIINVLLFLATYIFDSSMNIKLDETLALYYFDSPHFKPFQYISHIFMHGGIMHIFFNMFALFMFGKELEIFWGSKRFFSYYMITGIGAAAFYTLTQYFQISAIQDAANLYLSSPDIDKFTFFINDHFPEYYSRIYDVLILPWSASPLSTEYIKQSAEAVQILLANKVNIPTVGASGAVYGILLAFGMMFPNVKLMMIFPLPMPIKAKYLVIIYGLMELGLGIANRSGDNVAHFAHLGGMIFGFGLIKYWISTSKKRN